MIKKLRYMVGTGESCVAYHATRAPDGEEIDLRKVNLAELARQGWADHPAKVGLNPWGPSAARRVATIKADTEAGRVARFAIDKASLLARQQQAYDEQEQRSADGEKRVEQARHKQNAATREEAKTAEERRLDLTSDAHKKRYTGATPKNLSSAVRQQERVKEIQDADPAGPLVTAETDLPVGAREAERLTQLYELAAHYNTSPAEVDTILSVAKLDKYRLTETQYQECYATMERTFERKEDAAGAA